MTEEISDKQTGVALAWLGTIGPLGAHRCYLGRWWSGVALGGVMLALMVWSGAGMIALLGHVFGEPGGEPTIGNVLTRLGLTIVWGLWPGFDLWLLSSGRMRDGRGRLVQR